MLNKRWKKVLLTLSIIVVIYFIFIFLIYKLFNYIKYNEQFNKNIIQKGLVIEDISLKEYKENQIYIDIKLNELWFDKKRWCISYSEDNIETSELKEVIKNNCILSITPQTEYIIIKDEKNISEKINVEKYLNSILNIEVNIQDVLLLVGQKQPITLSYTSIGNPDMEIEYIVENEQVAKVEDGNIIGLSNGKTNIKICDKYGNCKNIKVIVTNLITEPKINDNKPFLREKIYTLEQAILLDEVLEYKINKAGNATRAGVVAAARFLSLEFMYKIPYFLENGRLQKHGDSDWIDGEGRYYHKGLYLSEDKYKQIESSTRYPAMWGKYIMEYSNDRVMPNGLDCSGFVSWAILNGGFNCGDIGAGPTYGYHVLTDLGKSQRITMNLLKSGNVKAGDLIGYDGHIGIIIGVEEGYIYVADTILYTRGVCATKYSYSELIYESGFTHIYDMSQYYKQDGNYTNMW